ncbi:MAG TPA: saccharopine dehydrogenase NADP-binding domain-containing protein [Tepidisphaeraceae bacterium]|nr:saccharopine dehydrogenase NADP-binding domain-containing protein [Tepidisphaeraceae bacterium]
MYPVVLVGAGKIGSATAKFLADSGDYDVLVIDQDAASLARVASSAKVKTAVVDVMNESQLKPALQGKKSVLSAVGYGQNPSIAKAALELGLSYFDLTEDVETTRITRALGEKAKAGQIFMPQCGLAPGFVSIAAHELALGFEKLHEVRLRVGALPVFPTNEMKYNLTWSTEGLINEYGNPCEAIHEGELIEVLPLEGYETFSLDGVDYEAFNTSGGVGTLAETLTKKAETLNYKTIRYRGHRDLMKFLMFELRLNEQRDVLKKIFENAIPMTPQDVVLIFCTVKGMKDGRFTEITDARKVYAGTFLGQRCSAIQMTTACALCASLDLHRLGKLPSQGFVKQEQVRLDVFLSNRFGAAYDVVKK